MLMHQRLTTQRVYSFISFYACSQTRTGTSRRGIATCIHYGSTQRSLLSRIASQRSGVGKQVRRILFISVIEIGSLSALAHVSCICSSPCAERSLCSAWRKEGRRACGNQEDIFRGVLSLAIFTDISAFESDLCAYSLLASIILIRTRTRVRKRSL